MILLLGASGFIGKNIARAFDKNHIEYLAPSRFELNIFSTVALHEYFEKHPITKIIWCVTMYSPLKNVENINDEVAFKNILVVCENFLVDIIYLGSMSEVNHSGIIKNENYFTVVPDTQYGKSKQLISNLLLQASNKIKKHNLRLFGVFGDGEDKHRLIPSVIDTVQTSNPLKLSDCLQERDFINVQAVADVVITIIQNPDVPSGLYNIGSGVGVQVRQLLLSVVPELYKPLLLFGEQARRPTDINQQIACIRRSSLILDLDQILHRHLDVGSYIKNEIKYANI